LREDAAVPTADKPDIAAIFANGKAIERAMTRAVREAVLRHKRLGQPVHTWRDGQVVEIPPGEIPDDGENWPPEP
jgi:hypothetical protein